MQKKIIVIAILFVVIIGFALYRLYSPQPLAPVEVKVETPIAPTAVPQNENSWEVCTTDSFSISLPGLPQHVREKVPFSNSNDLITYDMYLVQPPVGSTFMISQIRYPDNFDTSDPEQILDAITKEMLSNNADSRLISSFKGDFLGKPSIENIISNSSLYIYMKAFLNKKVLYVINVVDQEQERGKQNFEKALSSFHLLENQ